MGKYHYKKSDQHIRYYDDTTIIPICPSKKRKGRYNKFSQNSKWLKQVHREKESGSYTPGYGNQSSRDLKCGTGHRRSPGKGIMEDDCTRNPENWNNKSIK